MTIAYEILRAHNEALEAECWKMLADPERRGIAIIEHPIEFESALMDAMSMPINEYRFAATQQIEIGLDSRVPFGHIFRFEGRESYDAWVERGAPA